MAEIPNWLVNFFRYFLTPDFSLASMVMLVTWLVSGSFAEILDEMNLSNLMRLELDPGQEKGDAPARERLMSLFFTMGTFLVVLTGLVRLDIRTWMLNTYKLTFTNMLALAGGGASTLVFFLLGMALLSQTRYIDLHTR